MRERKISSISMNLLSYKTWLSNPSLIEWLNRIGLATIYLWFGWYKLIEESPAQELVTNLQQATFLHYIPANIFLLILGSAECIIGLLWLIPKFTKPAFIIFILHIITTFFPLYFLPLDTWEGMFVLNLSGKYIIKNIVLIASAVTIFYGYKKRMATASADKSIIK